MKKYILCLTGFLTLMQACKKDKDNDPVVTPYRFAAPGCLITEIKTTVDGETTDAVYAYDSQRRLISGIDKSGEHKATHTYSGNTMVDQEDELQPDGSFARTITVHYLNSTGYIERTVEEDSSQTAYTYNSEGYLIREVIMDKDGVKKSGTSHQYSNGNRETSYDLHFESGNMKDSALSIQYYYYDNLPGKIEEWASWTRRLGRGNRNELKSQEGGFSTAAYAYKMRTDGLPSALTLTFIFGTADIEFTWKCN